MSWTVIFGLTFATFLTLLIAPVMYMLTIRINYRIKKVMGTLPDENQPHAPAENDDED
jgi:multidrug efflux pump